MLEQLTYVQIGERLNISSEGARAIVKRNRLPRSHDKHGKTVVAIDLDELQHKPLPVRAPRPQPVNDVIATLKARVEQLEVASSVGRRVAPSERASKFYHVSNFDVDVGWRASSGRASY